MADALFRNRGLAIGLLLLLLSSGLTASGILSELGPRGIALLTNPQPGGELRRIIVLHSLLPRAAIAMIAGAALGLSGALLQRVLRNPIADTSTLGISAGAQLALAAAAAFLPGLGGLARETIAFGGGATAVALVLALGWRRDFEPSTLALAGMLVGLLAASASATLVLFTGQYLTSMFIWGGGSLAQQGWEPTQVLVLRLMIAGTVASLLLRPLNLLALDDNSVRSLGLSVRNARLAITLVAVALAASTVAQVGVIGFVGLAAPNLVRMLGARRPGQILVGAALLGGLILSVTDGLVQAANSASGLGVPTGAVTALFGGPFLLLLLGRLPPFITPSTTNQGAPSNHSLRPWRAVALMLGSLPILTAIAFTVGRNGEGLSIALGHDFMSLLPWRWPRLIGAMAAGSMLAAAGTMIQRMTGNPLASPEVLGISSTAGLALALTIILLPGATWLQQGLASASGALLGLILLLTAARRLALAANRLLLAGIALGALGSSGVTLALARGGLESSVILSWLTGSTQQITPPMALATLAVAAILFVPLPFATRWLQILPLGDVVSAGLGLNLRFTKLCLIILAALLTGAATLTLGPVSFIGLMAPHLARMMGLRSSGTHLAGAVLLGSILIGVADLLSRLIFYPYQMPIGLFVSLVGAPYLAWSLSAGHQRV